MSAYLSSGVPQIERRIKAATTAFPMNSFVEASAGTVIPATALTKTIVGVTANAVTSADSDYSTVGANISLIMPNDDTQFICDYTGGTPVEGGVYDLLNNVTVNAGASTIGLVTCIRVLDATTAVFKINSRESDINHK